MPGKLISRFREQASVAREDSDVAYMQHLLTFAEFIVKLSVAGLLGAIDNDSDRHRYRQLHALVRADGIGDWTRAIDEIVGGPTATHLVREARLEQRELAERVTPGTWQYDCVQDIDSCMRVFDASRAPLPSKVEGRRWYAIFAELRNRTRGHGATKAQQSSELIRPLESSISRFVDHFSLFRRDWAYMHRNLSGKYRVTPISITADRFNEYKSTKAQQLDLLTDGVYVYFDIQEKSTFY